MDDPVGDAVRSIVDGHIVLSRNLAQKGHFPSIDILQKKQALRELREEERLKPQITTQSNFLGLVSLFRKGF